MNGKTLGNSTLEHAVPTVGAGGPADLRLRSPFAVPRVADAWTACRMAVPRLPLKPLERVVLSLLLEDAHALQGAGDAAGDIPTPYSYAGIGASVGRCAHSAKSAVAALRKAGLLVTGRSARSGETVRVSVRPFLAWGASVCARGLGGATPAADGPSGNPGQLPTAQAAPVRRADETPRPIAPVQDATERRTAAEMRQEASGTPQDRVAHVAATPAPPPVPTHPAASCAPMAPSPADDDGLGPVGPGSDGPFLMEFGPEVDASAEREATLKAAGRSGDEDSDEITFGSDTADSDIGTGIEINMDL